MATNGTSFTTSQILILVFLWIFYGLVGHEYFVKFLSRMSALLRDLFRGLGYRFSNWAANFLQQYEVTEVEIFHRLNKNPDWENLAKVITTEKINQNVVPVLKRRIIGEKISGAVLGFVALLLMLYADAVQGSMTYYFIAQTAPNDSPLFQNATIPSFLNIPPIAFWAITLIGMSIINGLHLSDIVGGTNFTNSSQINTTGHITTIGKWNLVIRISNFALALLVLSFSTIADKRISEFASSFIIIPMLTTTFLSYEFITGLFLFLGFPLYILSAIVGILEIFTLLFIEIIEGVFYILWVPFDKIVATPIRFIVSLINKR